MDLEGFHDGANLSCFHTIVDSGGGGAERVQSSGKGFDDGAQSVPGFRPLSALNVPQSELVY